MNKKILLFVLILTIPAGVQAALSPEDSAKLTSNLQVLSQGWNQTLVDESNTILCNTSYNRADWDDYFLGYFTSNPFTNNLWGYLNYPVFFWCTPGAQLELQEGLVNPMEGNINSIMTTYSQNLSGILTQDKDLRDTLFRSHGFFGFAVQYGVLSDNTRSTIFNFYLAHIVSYPEFFKKSTTIDADNQPYIGPLRAQVHMNTRDISPILSQTIKDQITHALEIVGDYLSIWNDFSVLIMDNNQFDNAQLSVIHDLLSKVPQNIHSLGGIFQYDFLGNTGAYYEPITSYGTINIFPTPVGQVSQNQFPPDVRAKESDLFTMALVHELNHMVDYFTVSPDPALDSRRNALISQAGCAPLNYLRSMFEPCFFTNFPGEFFASISNQWFSNTEKTLELGLERFDNGYSEPLNQFLFFADVYSKDGLDTHFYTVDTRGRIRTSLQSITRDTNGNIDSITSSGGTYIFTLDNSGNVLDYRKKRGKK